MTIFNQIYWATRLCAFGSFCTSVIIIDIILLVAGLIFFACVISESNITDSKDQELAWKEIQKVFYVFLYITLIPLVICSIGAILCPDKTDLALIYGWEALHSDTAQEVFDIVRDQVIGK